MTKRYWFTSQGDAWLFIKNNALTGVRPIKHAVWVARSWSREWCVDAPEGLI